MTNPSASTPAAPVTIRVLRAMKERGDPIASLTAYDAGFARILDAAGVDVVLVGDSLGMVVQGHDTTLPVTLADMIYHTSMVARGRHRALVVADMPFMSYATPAQALGSAGRLMKEGGAQMVKLEGGAALVDTVGHLARHGIPVCGHLGLLPQSVHQTGGYHVQGRDPGDAEQLIADATGLEAAGASLLVVECIPSVLAARVVQQVGIPVIGIGAGPDCDGQVLVLQDMLGMSEGGSRRFARDFLAGSGSVHEAVAAYVRAVKRGEFPGPEHTFK